MDQTAPADPGGPTGRCGRADGPLEPFDLLTVTGVTVVATRSGAGADAIKDVDTVAAGPIGGCGGGGGNRVRIEILQKTLEPIQGQIYL
jgi:hypothetical protein